MSLEEHIKADELARKGSATVVGPLFCDLLRGDQKRSRCKNVDHHSIRLRKYSKLIVKLYVFRPKASQHLKMQQSKKQAHKKFQRCAEKATD